MKEKILIIEDEKSIAAAIAYAFRREGYTVEVVHHGEDAMKSIVTFNPDALILDIMLPGMDGYEVLKRLEEKRRIGVIMLTAKEDIVNKILGLELGADDYITKPFDMRELIARVKSLLRRMEPIEEKEAPSKIIIGEVVLHLTNRTAYSSNQRLDLTPKEFDLLALLLSNPGRVYTREQLLDRIWGMDYFGGTRTVDVHMQRIRKKLGTQGSEILHTVHGVGYKALGG